MSTDTHHEPIDTRVTIELSRAQVDKIVREAAGAGARRSSCPGLGICERCLRVNLSSWTMGACRARCFMAC